jgi:O-methyltransferase
MIKAAPPKPGSRAAELYLDLLQKTLTRFAFGETFEPIRPPKGPVRRGLLALFRLIMVRRDLFVVRRPRFDPALRAEGKDWPAEAETMVGLKRLENLQYCITEVLRDGVPGDLLEAGVWRGGASIFMKGCLEALGDCGRRVWLADSFEGLPPPDPVRYPKDEGDRHWQWRRLAVPEDEVRDNFRRYGLLDDRVRFLRGWFADTLPAAPVDRLAVLRLDGDMYGSTMETLQPLYPKVSPGGFIIVDDYGAVPACRAAVEDYRSEHGVSEPLVPIDWTGVFWRKAGRP